ncbi:MAG: DUF3127 domain-containing protein [Verrucomicrobiota bacterium]|jgi:hypothetical protein
MAFELEGTLKVVMETQTFGSGFVKREFVVTIGEDRYPQDIKLEFVKDKVSLLDRYKPGQKVKVGFDLRGGEHNGRYYVNLQAWRIHPADGTEGSGSSTEGQTQSTRPAPSQERTGPRPARQVGSGGDRGDRGGGSNDRWDRGGSRDGGRDGGRPKRGEQEFRGRRSGHAEEDDIDF